MSVVRNRIALNNGTKGQGMFWRNFFVGGVFGFGLIFFPACQKEEADFGSGQRAHQKEVAVQNRVLLEQFVLTTEELEKHPDPAYLENSLSRLNSWLTTCEPSRDFRPSEDYQAKEALFRTLSESAGEIDRLYRQAVPPTVAEPASETAQTSSPQSATEETAAEKATAEGSLTEEEGNRLMAALDSFLSAIREPKEVYRSPLFAQYETMAADLKAKLTDAQKFQFGDKGKMMKTALARFTFPPLLNFRVFAEGTENIARLCQLDARAFRSEDAQHFRSAVWERNVASWVVADGTDPTVSAMNLFDWTCSAIPLRLDSVAGAIPQTAWQTMLTSQGNGRERAVVFMDLLRQIGITSFLIRPVSLPADKIDGFPILVGVVLPSDRGGEASESGVSSESTGSAPKSSDVFLFLPEWGIPVPGPNGPTLQKEGEGPKGLRFDSVATLSEVARDDALLRRLDLPDDPFPVTSADLQEVRALVATNFFNMSERMWIMMRESVIERKNDAGEDIGKSFIPPVLALSFDSIQSEIEGFSHIASVEHGWELQAPILEQTILPIESQLLTAPYLYSVQAGDDLSARTDTDSSQKIAPQEGTGSGPEASSPSEKRTICPLWEGKILYFKGDFITENGAASRLQQGRVSDRVLKQTTHDLGGNLMEYMARIQEEEQVRGNDLSEEELRTLANRLVSQGRQEIVMKIFLKVTARYYLGLISLALGNDEAALNHLEDTDLLTKLDGLWKPGALRLLARIYEKRGDFERAGSIYARQEGSSGRGDRLRARWLMEAVAGESVGEPNGEETENKDGGTDEETVGENEDQSNEKADEEGKEGDQ